MINDIEVPYGAISEVMDRHYDDRFFRPVLLSLNWKLPSSTGKRNDVVRMIQPFKIDDTD